jgi:hypothetical protein
MKIFTTMAALLALSACKGKDTGTNRLVCQLDGHTLYDGSVEDPVFIGNGVAFTPQIGPQAGMRVTMVNVQCVYGSRNDRK